MTQDLSADFYNVDEFRDTPIDHFIENIHVRLLGCGIRTTDAGMVDDFMFPAFLAVHYREGDVEIRRGKQTSVLGPGAFYLFRPYDIYNGHRISEEPVCLSFLQFDLTPFMERYGFGTVALSFADVTFQDLRYRRFGDMIDELADDGASRNGRQAQLELLAKGVTSQMIYDQSQHGDGLGSLVKGRESRLVNQAFQYAAGHLSEPVVIGNILKDCATSKTTLDRAFRDTLGMTPQRALLRFKIERSMEMIQQGLSLDDITGYLGFSSVYHYSNTFLAVTGIRPTEYRRTMHRT